MIMVNSCSFIGGCILVKMKIVVLLLLLLVSSEINSASIENDPDVAVNGTEGANYNSTAFVSNETHPPKDSHSTDLSGDPHHSTGIHVASWNFDYVRSPLLICLFVVITAICKVGFHHADFLSSKIPESCLLIILGTIVGAILKASQSNAIPRSMQPDWFFLYLLPPIILESAYSLHDRTFFNNLGTVLMFAVVGTILSCFLIGPTMYGLAEMGAMGQINITFVQMLLFSALIVAVDPVAVLAIFQEIGVNNTLYFLVFGESLLNDAVTVVLYNTMKAFNSMDVIDVGQVFLAVAAFCTVSLGGLTIGIIFGVLTSFITKFTEHIRVVEPLAVLVLAYTAYLCAELFHFSGIISIIGCGLVQAQYAFHNISHKSFITVKYFSKMLSSCSDAIIFLFLGLTLVRDHKWHAGFTLWTIILCLFYRFLIVFGLSAIANSRARIRLISREEQFIMAYGGLRGAVAFSLADMLDKDESQLSQMFVTSTLAVIIFTVFVQGITIKPLVKLLRIKKQEIKIESMSEEINMHVNDHVLAGIEEIIGHHGEAWLRETFNNYDHKYFKRWLQRCPQSKDEQIMEIYQKIALRQHYENIAGSKAAERYASNLALSPEFENEGLLTTRYMIEHMPQPSDYRKMVALRTRQQTLELVRSGSDGSLILDFPTSQYWKSQSIQEHTEEEYERLLDNPEMMHAELDKKKTTSITSSQDKIIKDPKPSDLRKMMVKNPGRNMRQSRADKNIVSDDDDLVSQLHDKQRRTDRYKRSMSVCYTPTGSMSPLPRGSLAYFRPRCFTESAAAHDEHHAAGKANATFQRSKSIPMESTSPSSPKANRVTSTMEAISESDEEADGTTANGKIQKRPKFVKAHTIDTPFPMEPDKKDEQVGSEEDIFEPTSSVETPPSSEDIELHSPSSETDPMLPDRGDKDETKVDIEDPEGTIVRQKSKKLSRKSAVDHGDDETNV